MTLQGSVCLVMLTFCIVISLERSEAYTQDSLLATATNCSADQFSCNNICCSNFTDGTRMKCCTNGTTSTCCKERATCCKGSGKCCYGEACCSVVGGAEAASDSSSELSPSEVTAIVLACVMTPVCAGVVVAAVYFRRRYAKKHHVPFWSLEFDDPPPRHKKALTPSQPRYKVSEKVEEEYAAHAHNQELQDISSVGPAGSANDPMQAELHDDPAQGIVH